MGCELVGTFLLCLLPSLIIENQTLANNDSSRVSHLLLRSCIQIKTGDSKYGGRLAYTLKEKRFLSIVHKGRPRAKKCFLSGIAQIGSVRGSVRTRSLAPEGPLTS